MMRRGPDSIEVDVVEPIAFFSDPACEFLGAVTIGSCIDPNRTRACCKHLNYYQSPLVFAGVNGVRTGARNVGWPLNTCTCAKKRRSQAGVNWPRYWHKKEGAELLCDSSPPPFFKKLLANR